MSTGTDIILGALEAIKVHSVANPAPPESIVKGRDVLNGLISEWLTASIDVGAVPLDDPADELGEVSDATNALVEMLALRLHPYFESTTKLEQLRTNAKRSFEHVRKHYQSIEIPEPVPSSTTPVGAGNMRGVKRRPFAGRNRTVSP